MFAMGAKFDDGWSLDRGEKQEEAKEYKTPEKHRLHFAKEKRKGKVLTIVKPFCIPKEELETLFKALKKSLATGGALREESLEFQGEVSDKLRELLISRGYGCKK